MGAGQDAADGLRRGAFLRFMHFKVSGRWIGNITSFPDDLPYFVFHFSAGRFRSRVIDDPGNGRGGYARQGGNFFQRHMKIPFLFLLKV